MENFPVTDAGITVFKPESENAPSMPCRESEGIRIRPISKVALSSERAIGRPVASSTS